MPFTFFGLRPVSQSSPTIPPSSKAPEKQEEVKTVDDLCRQVFKAGEAAIKASDAQVKVLTEKKAALIEKKAALIEKKAALIEEKAALIEEKAVLVSEYQEGLEKQARIDATKARALEILAAKRAAMKK